MTEVIEHKHVWYDWADGAACPININDRWQEELPGHTVDEYDKLEQSILSNGCLDPIDLNRGYVAMDGMTRFEICQKHQIGFWFRVWDTIEEDDDSRYFMWSRQLQRRNLDEIARRRGILAILKIENVRHGVVTASEMEGGDEETEDVETPDSLTASREVRQSVAEQAGVSQATVGRAIQDQKIIDGLTKHVKKHATDPAEKITSAELKKLDSCESLGEIETELRMTRSDTLRDAWHRVMGKPLTAKRTPKQETNGESVVASEKTPLEEFRLKTKGLQKSLVSIASTVLEIGKLFPGDTEGAAINEILGKAGVALEQWRNKHAKDKAVA